MTKPNRTPKPYRELAAHMRRWQLEHIAASVHCMGTVAYVEDVVETGKKQRSLQHVPGAMRDLLKLTRRRRHAIEKVLHELNQPFVRKRLAGRTIHRDDREFRRSPPLLVAVATGREDKPTRDFLVNMFNAQYRNLAELEEILQRKKD